MDPPIYYIANQWVLASQGAYHYSKARWYVCRGETNATLPRIEVWGSCTYVVSLLLPLT